MWRKSQELLGIFDDVREAVLIASKLNKDALRRRGRQSFRDFEAMSVYVLSRGWIYVIVYVVRRKKTIIIRESTNRSIGRVSLLGLTRLAARRWQKIYGLVVARACCAHY